MLVMSKTLGQDNLLHEEMLSLACCRPGQHSWGNVPQIVTRNPTNLINLEDQ